MHTSANKPVVSFGETLWDLLPTGKLAGGAPMNVAMSLHQLGEQVVFISAVGQDALGEELLAYIRTQGLDTSYIQRVGDYPTGRVHVDVSDPTEVRYDIEFPAAWDFIDLDEQNLQAAKDARLMVYGSLAARNENSRQTLLELLPHASRRVFDVNLRQPHYTPEHLDLLMKQAHWVKLNHHELRLITDWLGLGGDDEQRMRALQQQYGLEAVCVTLGADGAMMWQQGQLFRQKGFQVKVKDTIGSGDAFLAAWISQMLAQKSPQQCLRYACALGALVASHKGANPTISPQQIQTLINSQAA
ncbi:MAG: carbohydrate kinase [Bacteroidetes bacterium]|nr:MAG: carbohydrate kinase [Bacteroidota bacterium]